MQDYQLRTRIPMDVIDDLKSIIDYINDTLPEVNPTISTITRHALKDYAKKFNSRIFDGSIFTELPLKQMSENDLNMLLDTFKHLDHQSDDIEIVKSHIDTQLLTLKIDNATKGV